MIKLEKHISPNFLINLSSRWIQYFIRLKDNQPVTMPRYQIYSAHDTQIVLLLTQLIPKWDWAYIQYASMYTFELRLDNQCFMKVATDESFDGA